MPRLPKNLYRRGNSFYFRTQKNGKDMRISLGTDLREARRRAALLRAGQHEIPAPEKPPEEPTVTVGAFAKRWRTEYIAQRRNTKGRVLSKQRFRDHVAPVIGGEPLQAVTLADLRRLRGTLEAKGLAAMTVRHILSDLRCLFRYAVEVGERKDSPWRSSLLPRMVEEAPKRLTDEDVEAVLDAATGGYSLAIRLALATGLRWGELHRLQWRHVIGTPHPHLVLEKTKSGRVRRVPLPPDAVALLKQERARTKSVFVLPFRAKNPCSFVDRIEVVSGVRWHFHQLRHTFACRWLEAGGSKEALQKILGHSTIRLTERYGALSDDAVFAEASFLGRNNSEKSAQKSAQAALSGS
jgi:integrase